MLGASETIGTFPELFHLVDRKHKIYAKKLTSARIALDFSGREYMPDEPAAATPGRNAGEPPWKEIDLHKEADHVGLNQYAPSGVLVNDEMQVLQFRGDPSAYLRPAPGRASFDLMRMAREGLMVELRSAIQEARKTQAAVSQEGVTVKSNG